MNASRGHRRSVVEVGRLRPEAHVLDALDRALKLQPLVREFADRAEAERRLPGEVAAALARELGVVAVQREHQSAGQHLV